jgi:hypothetical protein
MPRHKQGYSAEGGGDGRGGDLDRGRIVLVVVDGDGGGASRGRDVVTGRRAGDQGGDEGSGGGNNGTTGEDEDGKDPGSCSTAGGGAVSVGNPATQEFEVCRTSLLPSALMP